ncbi:MAG: preprotein translocase subunit YajC [Bdellovibrionales bacterium]|nr:preprotein translocase subunit YajC [Bdellovibrionales bacterium]
MFSVFSQIAWAQQANGASAPNFLEQMIPFVFIFLIFFFLIIRPQQKRHKKQQEFMSSLKRGDSVLTSGGILGTIEGLTEKFVTLEVADGVRLRILKSQISGPSSEEQK